MRDGSTMVLFLRPKRKLRMRALLDVGILSALLGLAGIVVAQVPNTAPPFSLTISSPQSSFKIGSDVTLELKMTNTSNRNISFGAGWGMPVVDIEIHDVDGKQTPETPYGLRLHRKDPRFALQDSVTGPVTHPTLRPGESNDSIGSLNKIYDLSKPGEYTIQVQRMDPDSKILVKSNTLTITVTP